MMNTRQSEYYRQVNEYYNRDAPHFEQRSCENPLLQRMRQSFREESMAYARGNILEIGFGAGSDLLFFAASCPESQVYGIDISDEMKVVTANNIASSGLGNITIATGSVEDIAQLFPGVSFDFIYVYFGALNTVEDLGGAARQLEQLLSAEGTMVLTFINKYFLSLIVKNLAHGRIRQAFARLRKIWGGYSPYRYLASKCYTFKELRTLFSGFDIVRKRGYSIVFPAWYEYTKFGNRARLLDRLWLWDIRLNKTPLWQGGEYALYVMKKKTRRS